MVGVVSRRPTEPKSNQTLPQTSCRAITCSTESECCKRMATATAPYQHPSLKGIKYVLFPQDKYVQYWDNFFLFILLYYCFAIPYTVGISGGYYMYKNEGWFWVNVFLNITYVTDTIMQFFRAYYDEDGVIVYNLRKIARHYVFSGRLFVNLLASFPMQAVIIYLERKYRYIDGIIDSRDLNLIVIGQLLRLLRIPRVNSLSQSSIAIQTWWERQDVARAMLASFIFKLIVVSHWIACFWSFIAYAQVWSFGDALGEEANWISNWYESNYVKGGIHPIGWQNDIDRYGLSLFWSIQTITSIGYGNISPVTRVEYYFANILMLSSGLFWAFTIGSIVSIVEHMNSSRQQYKHHLDEANTAIRSFSFSPTSSVQTDEDANVGVGEPGVVATRIRRFISRQYDRKITNHPTSNGFTLDEVYPTLKSLSPELRRLSSLHLMRKYLEMVPYLSSKYLNPHEQSELAFKCVYLEFAKGETFIQHPEFGRGVMILKRGMALSIDDRNSILGHAPMEIFGIDDPIAVNDVLVEDASFGNKLPVYRFASYSLAVFIPQAVIYEMLGAKKAIWKSCARWKYLQTCFANWASDIKQRQRKQWSRDMDDEDVTC